VNESNVILADIKAFNGVIHAIDKVMFPPAKNLVELALSYDPEFSILVAAVQKAGLVETLATGGPFTVFAPTNDAFVALLGELGASSLDDIDVQTLTNVLLYHVVSGRVYSSDLISGPVETLNGTFNIDLSTLKITDARGRESGLVPSLLNVQANNGVIHVINKVILP
jgi:transforming growth factor-beta-induced protein